MAHVPTSLALQRVDEELEPFLDRSGHVFRAFREQDSGCVSFGIEAGGARWFVKQARTERACASLVRARCVHAAVRHPAVPRLRHRFEASDGPALVFEWADGECLYPSPPGGLVARRDPDSAHARLRALPSGRTVTALETVFDVVAAVAESGFVFVDFYDGCVLYDFAHHVTHVVDLDEARPGPFRLDTDRLPGSKRFMAPEESLRGATIDERTDVFHLGRLALELLADGSDDPGAWRASSLRLGVVRRACSASTEDRHPTVAALVADWARAGT